MKTKNRVLLIVILSILSLCIVFGILLLANALPASLTARLNTLISRNTSVNQQQPTIISVSTDNPQNKNLPDPMHGIWYDLNTDLEASENASYGAIVSEFTEAFSFFKNFMGDTMFITPDHSGKYGAVRDSYGTAVDVLRELFTHADSYGYYKVLVADDALLLDGNGSFTFEKIRSYLSAYPFDAVLLDSASLKNSQKTASAVSFFGNLILTEFPNCALGLTAYSDAAALYADADTVAALQSGAVGFCVIDAGGALRSAQPFGTVMAWWNTFAAGMPQVRFFCRHRNDLVMSNGSDWNSNIEISDQVRFLWDCEKIRGSVFYNASALRANKNASSQRLSYLFYDGALDDFEVDSIGFSGENTVTFAGKAAANRKLTCNRTVLSAQGGAFNYTFALQAGSNLFSFFNAGKQLDFRIFHVTPESAAAAAGSGNMEGSPFVDHGLGTSLMCRVLDENTESVGLPAEKNTYHPDYSTMPVGTLDYVKAITVSSEGDLRYELSSGNNVYAVHCELLNQAYTLPANRLSVLGVSDADPSKTEITLQTDWFVPVNVKCLPQSYYGGYQGFSFNISSFTATYVDVTFAHTQQFNGFESLAFAANSPFARAELFSAADAVILRLHLRRQGQFYGYHVSMNQAGQLVLSFKKHVNGSLAGKVVMLDAGHGGLSMTGTALRDESIAEKITTLSITLKAKQMLEAYGATVLLTRYLDTPLSLEDRCAILSANDPDIFVSIHCDGTDNINDSGTHTFYFRPYSMPLASAIHNSMVSVYRTYIYQPTDTNYPNIDRKIKYYPFFVTRMDHCPAVLVETGFMSNPIEGMILANDNYQYWMAQGIADGIRNYFSLNY